jgi:hypothetical protein
MSKFKENVMEFLESYKVKTKKVDRNADYYDLLIRKIPSLLKQKYGDSYYIKGSVGQATTADIP